MRPVVLAVVVLAASATAALAQPGPGFNGSRGDGARPHDGRGDHHRSRGDRPRLETNVTRFQRELRAAERRGNDTSRDVWTGFRWSSDNGAASQGSLSEDPGLRDANSPLEDRRERSWFVADAPSGRAAPVFRGLDPRRIVRGPQGAAPAHTFAIRTVRGR